MTDLIQRITNAIFRQENNPGNNPGNLRSAPWLSGPWPVVHNGFWVPVSRAQGIAGAAHCVALRIAEGQTLRQLISAWAPASDGNNTAVYLANVQAWAEVANPDQPLQELL